MTVHPIWNDYPSIKSELVLIKESIKEQIFIRNEKVNHAAIEVFQTNGKMIRPAYSLIFSNLGKNSEPKRARDMAAAIEVFHNATLLHDDIVDDGTVRRGKPTIQSVYGKKAAVYAGDYLISVCFKMTHPYSQVLDTQGILTRAMERVIGGELQQLSTSYDQSVTIRSYLTQIRGKTAELFGLSCLTGAMESGMSKKQQALSYRIGVQIGMAFQLMDDLLEYTQDETRWEKSFFQDIKNGIYTAPVIFSLKKTPDFFKKVLSQQDLSEDDIAEMREQLYQSKGIDDAYRLAEKYTEKALYLIGQLPETPGKEELSRLTEKLLYREI